MASSIPDSFQSFRSSCDRCRYQKLRCTASPKAEDSGSCQRCLRAKVQCVFTRRARSSKQPSKNSAKRKSSDASPCPDFADSPAETLPSPSPSQTETMGGAEDTPESGMNVRFNSEESSTIPNLGQLQPGGSLVFPFIDPVYTGANTPSSTDMYSMSNDHTVFDVLHDICFSQPESNYTAPDISDISRPASSTEFNRQVFAPFLAADTYGTSQIGGNTEALDLCSILSEIHLSLNTLKAWNWTRTTSQGCFDNYPIGNILHITEQIVSVVRKEAHSRNPLASYLGALQDHKMQSPADTFLSHENKESSALPMTAWPQDTEEEAGSTTRMLLNLTIYLTLTQLYGRVFTHLQEYILTIPVSSHGHRQRSSPNPGRAFRGQQLGDLPSTNDAWAKLYTAVTMLLDALGRVEDAIELPHALRSSGRDERLPRSEEAGFRMGGGGGAGDGDIERLARNEANDDMASAVLRYETRTGVGGLHEGCNGLKRMIRQIKELLREKLDP